MEALRGAIDQATGQRKAKEEAQERSLQVTASPSSAFYPLNLHDSNPIQDRERALNKRESALEEALASASEAGREKNRRGREVEQAVAESTLKIALETAEVDAARAQEAHLLQLGKLYKEKEDIEAESTSMRAEMRTAKNRNPNTNPNPTTYSFFMSIPNIT